MSVRLLLPLHLTPPYTTLYTYLLAELVYQLHDVRLGIGDVGTDLFRVLPAELDADLLAVALPEPGLHVPQLVPNSALGVAALLL